jgi:hypothetical protein
MMYNYLWRRESSTASSLLVYSLEYTLFLNKLYSMSCHIIVNIFYYMILTTNGLMFYENAGERRVNLLNW